MRLSLWSKGAAALAVLALPALAPAQELRPSLNDSLRLGSGSGLLCRLQNRVADPALASMFDRAYAVVCRDAAAPVAQVYALRAGDDEPGERLARLRADRVRCTGESDAEIEGLGEVAARDCTLASSPVGYAVYRWRNDDTVYVAEGLAGYDSAIRLALRSVVADRMIPGELAIATTEMGDAAAFASVQAGTLSLDQALAEGYRRNNSGDYAEAAEFFETLLRRAAEDGEATADERIGEYLINQALQQSNLGDFDAAEATYARALAIPSASPTQLRLRRNFQAIHLLNQRRFDEALAVLDRGLAAVQGAPGETPKGAVIDAELAAQINDSSELARQIGGEESLRLTNAERARILDAQAMQLRGAILRALGRPAEARDALEAALAAVAEIRDGRVRSTARLQSEALFQLALVAEETGDPAAARGYLERVMSLMETQYPRSLATSAARARLAAFLARQGATAEALALFAEVIEANRDEAVARTALENQLAPYFELLLAAMEDDPALVNQFFLATETLVRPGVANTQAVLARELSGGNDEAARLFRQSVTLTREIASTQTEIARLRGLDARDAAAGQQLEALEAELAQLVADQTATQAQLSQFPRYRAVSTEALTLPALQATLQPGEAYLKLAEVTGRVYGIFATRETATAYRLPIGAETLEARVADLRQTISTVEDGVQLTYPFDVRLAHRLFGELMGPVADQLAGVRHLVFEPDGAMLRLPANLLVTDEAGVAAYEARLDTVGNDAFDFTGIDWLGRDMAISTAVSARGFRDVRNLPPSAAARQYLGFGENAPPAPTAPPAEAQGGPETIEERCGWPPSIWAAPVSANELRTARRLIGEGGSDIVTGEDFTDLAVMQRGDLDQFRIVHFATHGLVTQPSAECPPRPALLTSFGETAASDGLLSFGEIFDLKLDADLIILSACDTAAAAGVAATRAAGLRGGASALDGLVRAFVGAGSRVVVASHWPAPDDFAATERLMTGLFEAAPGTSLGEAMLAAERTLMDDPATSHPYYWSGFAIVGDGTQPVVRAD